MRTKNYNKAVMGMEVVVIDYNAYRLQYLKVKRKKTPLQKVFRVFCILCLVSFLSGVLTGVINSEFSTVSAQESTRKFNPVKIGFVIKTDSVELNNEVQSLLCPKDSEGRFCQDSLESDKQGRVAGVVGLLREQHKLDKTVFLNVKPLKEGFVYSLLILDKANNVLDYCVDSVQDLEEIRKHIKDIGGNNGSTSK